MAPEPSLPEKTLWVQTFGGLSFAFGGQPEDSLASKRVQAGLLVYLAVQRRASVSEVTALFWEDTANPRQTLHTTAHRLRKAYGPLFEISEGEIQATDLLRCDLEEWDQAVTGDDLQTALALYKGPFLRTWNSERVSFAFGRWVERTESKLSREVRVARVQFGEQLISERRTQECIQFAREWIASEPSEDEAHHCLMRALAAAGRTEEALESFEAYREILAQEDLDPVEALLDYAEHLKTVANGRSTAMAVTGGAREWRHWAAAAALVAVIAVFAWNVANSRTAPAVAVEQFELNRVAVLEFEDLSPDQSLEALARGLPRSLVHQLATAPQIQVVSSPNLWNIDPGSVDAGQIGRDFGVANVITGQVQAADGMVRVFVQMVDPVDGEFVRSQQFDFPESDLFQLQDEITQFVTRFLRERLGDELRIRGYQAGTRSGEAWVMIQDAYGIAEPLVKAHGMTAEHRDPGINERLQRATGLAEQAIALDPDWPEAKYVRAMVELAKLEMGTPGEDGSPAPQAQDVIDLARRVLEVDPEHARAIAMIGQMFVSQSGARLAQDPSGDSLRSAAEEYLTRAVELQPSLASAWVLLGDLALMVGDFERSRTYALRALEEDPFLGSTPDIYHRIGLVSLMLEDFETAETWLRRGHQEYPAEVRFLEGLLTLEGWSGVMGLRPDSILRILEQADAIDPPTLTGMAREFLYLHRRLSAAGALAQAGEEDRAWAMLDSLRSDVAEQPVWYADYVGSEIAVLLVLGDTAGAVANTVRWLEDDPIGWSILQASPGHRAVIPHLPDSVVAKHR